ncbi:MAG: carbon-nitrogen hydrolase family protein [Bacteroidetes bacterium]|nr:carbon-nitrogen hydrolase family protein [Bacteroidota bacterium]
MEDRRKSGKKFQTSIIIDPSGNIVGEHQKTSITKWEVENGYSRGDSINVVDTKIGSIGLAICYEIHFPEISRIYALKGAKIILNPIGTGMWHESQLKQWTSIASARASENNVYVLGCSHFNDAIPLAFAYDPNGNCLVLSRDANRLITVTIDLNKLGEEQFSQRRPELYGELIKTRMNLNKTHSFLNRTSPRMCL